MWRLVRNPGQLRCGHAPRVAASQGVACCPFPRTSHGRHGLAGRCGAGVDIPLSHPRVASTGKHAPFLSGGGTQPRRRCSTSSEPGHFEPAIRETVKRVASIATLTRRFAREGDRRFTQSLPSGNRARRRRPAEQKEPSYAPAAAPVVSRRLRDLRSRVDRRTHGPMCPGTVVPTASQRDRGSRRRVCAVDPFGKLFGFQPTDRTEVRYDRVCPLASG